MTEKSDFSIDSHKGFQLGLYAGVDLERKRIIKLLFETPEGRGALLQAIEYDGGDEAIALIKGENK